MSEIRRPRRIVRQKWALSQTYRGWLITFDTRRPPDKVWRGVCVRNKETFTASSKGALKRKINAHEERSNAEGSTEVALPLQPAP